MLPTSILVSLIAFIAVGEAATANINGYITGRCGATDTSNCLALGYYDCYSISLALHQDTVGGVCAIPNAEKCPCGSGTQGLTAFAGLSLHLCVWVQPLGHVPDLPSGGVYTDLHVTVSTGTITEPNQGKWPYTLGKGQCSTANGKVSCNTSIADTWRKCEAAQYVYVHASFMVDGTSDAGWGKGTCIEARFNCPKWFTFTPTCKCSKVATYEP
ncbi:hypothetical protein PTMSG1_02787 [Pyrenophora teres f. maculata]|nr:hypothetical protein PTMSG1_02787 [Pyrenophora teres f. maculata]